MKVHVDGQTFDTDEVQIEWEDGDFLVIDEDSVMACNAGTELSDANVTPRRQLFEDGVEDDD